jgi:hypothetical protein
MKKILIKYLKRYANKWCKNNFLHPLKFKFVDEGAIFSIDCLQIARLASGNIRKAVTGTAYRSIGTCTACSVGSKIRTSVTDH